MVFKINTRSKFKPAIHGELQSYCSPTSNLLIFAPILLFVFSSLSQANFVGSSNQVAPVASFDSHQEEQIDLYAEQHSSSTSETNYRRDQFVVGGGAQLSRVGNATLTSKLPNNEIVIPPPPPTKRLLDLTQEQSVEAQSATRVLHSQQSRKAQLSQLARKLSILGNTTASTTSPVGSVPATGNLLQLRSNNPLSPYAHGPNEAPAVFNALSTGPYFSTNVGNPTVLKSYSNQALLPRTSYPTIKQQRKKNFGLLEKICMGTSYRLSAQQNKSDHYQNLVERYKNCTYVMGNLEITWLDRSSNPNLRPSQDLDLSFLESIREITGYLLIAYVDVERISMPNLQIIRGRDLFKSNTDEKEEFAMILIENNLKQLELPFLREILVGSVGSYNNRNLCHIRTINWDEILNTKFKSVFVYDGIEPECPPCDNSCQEGSCWGEGAQMCQKFSKVTCSPRCGTGRCFGTAQNECCHQMCAGGCTGPSENDCLACKNYYYDGSCIENCPAMMRYNPNLFLWELNPNGKYAFGSTCVKECPEHMLRDSGACVRNCPANKRSSNGECVPCGGPCPKRCQGVEMVHSDNIDQLINCTVIEGSITVLDESFSGNTEITTKTNTTIRHKPMHPSRLEVFKTLREITGYLNIRAKHVDFRNLSCFTNLKIIGGRQTTDMFQPTSLSITRTSLVSLNLRSLRKVRGGKITIEDNPELCFADTIDWKQIDFNHPLEDVAIRNNADVSKCRQANLQCNEQCARDGCWGPGPDECLSCNNYKVDDYCVVNCSSTEQMFGFLAFENSTSSRLCHRCHQECRHGCTGLDARDCLQCKSVKDGPYCVPECPRHKYNNNGICEECDKSCGSDGCTGPSNKLGKGGCNSCAKVIIKSTNGTATTPVQNYIECLRAEESCPDGYYQEYLIGSSQPDGSPLKSSAGRPICRKCHHRCKRCIGMGTHKTVCECAKYILGEQCEDHCSRDYFADEESRQCIRCSPTCDGCFGPTEADCTTCRTAYRIYYNVTTTAAAHIATTNHTSFTDLPVEQHKSFEIGQQTRFNCTEQCPPDKPNLISEPNMLDPYCSAVPVIDNQRNAEIGSTSILFSLIIIASLMLCVSIYRCQIEKDKTVKLTMHLSGIDDVEPLSPSNLKPNMAELRSIKETELRKGKVLGSGFGGTVYQGFWYPEGQEHVAPRPVAIKVLRDNGESNLNKEFLEEAYTMTSVRHPNLVRLLGVCSTPNHLMLVTPLMPLGCLLDYVKKNLNDIGAKNLLEWGKQIARGMAYLEENRMVHRDLALRNVLLQTSGRALISDFGLAKFLEIDQSAYHSGERKLPIKWLAPECYRQRKFTHKSDVWAFGVTIWELITFGQRPFDDYETKDVPLAIEKGARLHQPNNVSAEVYKVMYSCWFYSPEDRPSFKSLVQNFVQFARDPERYLICGSKGIELSSGLHSIGSRNSDSDDNCDDYDSADDSSLSEGESGTASQPPLSAMPDLTPSTHNRLNERIFGFELRHHNRSSESETLGTAGVDHVVSNGAYLSSPTIKELNMLANHGASALRSHCLGEDVFHDLAHNHIDTKGSNNLMTDMNNNFIPSNNDDNQHNGNSCWTIHHTMSTNSLGQRSELPTDDYNYLLPSPYTDEHGRNFSAFYPPSYDGATHMRNPPHSAGLVANVTNEEYFITRANYENQKSDDYRRMTASNGNIPHSLV